MTDSFNTSNAPSDDVRDDEDFETARLDRQADALLAGGGTSGQGQSQGSGSAAASEGRVFGTETSAAFGSAGLVDAEDHPGVASVRQAVREDIQHGRDIARERAERARDAIRDEPIKSAVYAVGVGILIGLLLRR